jgi:catechol 2,3-dioxygenase
MQTLPDLKVSDVRAVDLGVSDVAGAVRFFTAVWHLEVTAEQDGVTYLRGTGRYRYILSLRKTPRAEVVRVVLGVPSRAAVEAMHARVKGRGGVEVQTPKALAWPGGGYGFGCKDPEGRNFAVVGGVEDYAEASPRPDRPSKISHVNLNANAYDASLAFVRDALGFRMTDETRRMRFLQCGTDHHSLVLCRSEKATLNHIAFEMPEIDSLMRGIGRMRDHGHPIEWGPGRHGPGNNVFAYFVGPEQLPLEYTTEMQQCDASYVGRPVEKWTWPPGRLDHWGLTPAPSARFEQTQALLFFSAEGHRL